MMKRISISTLSVLLLATTAWLFSTAVFPDSNEKSKGSRFSPEVGEERYFNLDLTMKTRTAGGAGSTLYKVSGVLRAKVAGKNSTGKTLEASLLEVEQINADGADIISDLPDASNEAYIIRYLLSQTSSVIRLPGVEIPETELRPGQGLHVGPQRIGKLFLPAAEYVVSHSDEDITTVKLKPALGYLQLDHRTGWPVRGRIQTVTKTTNGQEPVTLETSIELEQAGAEELVSPYALFANAGDALYSDPGSTYLPALEVPGVEAFEDYPTPEESLKKLESTTLWQGLTETGDARGLNAGLEFGALERIEFHTLELVKLIGADGKPVAKSVPVNPRFKVENLLPSMFSQSPTKVPFLHHELTEDQLRAIDRVEMVMPMTVVDERIEIDFQPGETRKQIGNSGLTLEVDHWTNDSFRLRIHSNDGFLPSQRPFIKTIPIGTDGTPVGDFDFRATHSLFETHRSPAIPNVTERLGVDEALMHTEAITESILSIPPPKRYGDWWHEIYVSGRDSIESVKVYFYTTETDVRTLVTPSASPAEEDGKLVGERTIDKDTLPDFSFPELNIHDLSISGVEDNILNVSLPGNDYERCQLSPGTNSRYRNSSLAFSLEKYFEPRGFNLVTQSREKHFHDVSLNLEIDCITKVVMKTAPADELPGIEMVDRNTIRLDPSAYQRLEEVRKGFNLPMLPLHAYSSSGAVLTPLSRAHLGALQKTDEQWNGQLRFWGEVAKVRYPISVERAQRKETVHFPAAD